MQQLLTIQHIVLDNLIEEDDLEYVFSVITSIQDKGLIKIIDNDLIVTEKLLDYFDSKDEVKQVVDYFNTLKEKHLGINRKTKYTTFYSEVNSRLRDYTLVEVKSVIWYMFTQWANDMSMRKHLSLETLLRPKNFSKYLDQSLTKVNTIKKTRNLL